MKIKNILRILLVLVLTLSVSLFVFSCSDNDTENNEEQPGDGENRPGEGEGGEQPGGEENGGEENGGEGNEGGEHPGTEVTPVINHSVTVLDSDGAPKSGIIVMVYNESGNRVAMGSTGKDGKAVFADIALGDYSFKLTLVSNSESVYYDESKCTLSKESYDRTVYLYSKLSSATVEIYGPMFNDESSENTGLAYSISCGSYYVSAGKGKTFFVFYPDASGYYRVSCESSKDVRISSHGIPNYVQAQDISGSDGKGFDLEVSPLQGDLSQYTPFVISIETEGGADCILTVKKVGEVSDNPIYKPWDDVTAKMDMDAFVVEEGKTFNYLNLADPSLKVVLDEDGYYHLGTVDGPLVVVKVSKETPYIASFADICETSTFGWYHFDEKGNFVKKEAFNNLILYYAGVCDAKNGVCPLTEELAYAIKMNGEYHNWWDFDSDNHIFGDDASWVLEDNAWLFACGTIQ